MNEQLILILKELDQLARFAVVFSNKSSCWPCNLININIPCKENNCSCPCCPMGTWTGGYADTLIYIKK